MKISRTLLAAVSVLFLIGVVAQVFLAGLFLFAGATRSWHMEFGYWLELPPLVALLLLWPARTGRRIGWLTLALALDVIVQTSSPVLQVGHSHRRGAPSRQRPPRPVAGRNGGHRDRCTGTRDARCHDCGAAPGRRAFGCRTWVGNGGLVPGGRWHGGADPWCSSPSERRPNRGYDRRGRSSGRPAPGPRTFSPAGWLAPRSRLGPWAERTRVRPRRPDCRGVGVEPADPARTTRRSPQPSAPWWSAHASGAARC